jgi:hypothetical protein
MKPTTAAQQALLNCETVRMALCLKLERPDGGLDLGFTSHDRELTIAGLAYKPEQSLSPSAIEGKADFSADSGELVLLSSDQITERELKGGVWDNAIATLFAVVDWSDLAAGTVPLKRARLGRFEVERGRFRVDLVGLGELVQQPVVDITSLLCRNRLGDASCRVPLKPAVWLPSTDYTEIEAGDRSVGSYVSPTTYSGLDAECIVAGTSGGSEPSWPAAGGTVVDGTVTWRTYVAWTQQGTVTIAHERVHFIASALTQAAEWFKYGKLTWLTGANASLSQDVRRHGAGGAFTLWDEMAEPIGVGDTFEVHAGCALRHDLDCRDKFDNIKNFNGEPFLPGSDEASQFPDAR